MNKIITLLGISLLFASWDAFPQTGFLRGETTSGMMKTCYYNVLGDSYAKTISNVDLCPVSINVNQSPSVNPFSSRSQLHPFTKIGPFMGAEDVARISQQIRGNRLQNQLLQLQIQQQRMQLEQSRSRTYQQNNTQTYRSATTQKSQTLAQPKPRIEEDVRERVRYIIDRSQSSKNTSSQNHNSSTSSEVRNQQNQGMVSQSSKKPLSTVVPTANETRKTEWVHEVGGRKIHCVRTGELTVCR